ncbi:DUF1338 domain-containing protein [Pseudoalteromonas denitrificans]|uniref:2-oxoadipate dioxygenase/decarboxylase n=1 Tax=Pseudoalteromonas denitrificans DSM 6059 TaxID=1123010 RepID=A0A1I1H3D3_9GAMM|nr:DUF1338 domain-containing protein [Pseudoalteromonas denitrificans]SFC15710.1 protein of unknown function [Pseudoalteromonas denitrificans DSM 6059]
MHNNVDVLFDNLWQNYLSVTPSAKKVHELLGSTQNDDVINDHIALRTFNIEKVGLEKLAAHLKAVGYTECGEYHFEAKKLFAKHFEHSDPTKPKVFISELLVEKFSEELQKVITDLVDQIDEEAITADNFLYSGTHWSLDSQTYKKLLEESEYAAWTAAWGYRANHFTVSINYLENFDSIEVVNQKLKDADFALNATGGEIKGSPEVLLEQSSTLADNFNVKFSDCEMAIPSCFYEFALRYNKPDGEIYTGFVAASADKIFESTNAR